MSVSAEDGRRESKTRQRIEALTLNLVASALCAVVAALGVNGTVLSVGIIGIVLVLAYPVTLLMRSVIGDAPLGHRRGILLVVLWLCATPFAAWYSRKAGNTSSLGEALVWSALVTAVLLLIAARLEKRRPIRDTQLGRACARLGRALERLGSGSRRPA
jgi:hypothetical protein